VIGLAYSVRDPAGKGIAEYLVKELKLRKSSVCRCSEACLEGDLIVLAGFNEDVIYFDFLESRLPSDIDFYIVLSRHSSEAGVRSYTVHATGNFSSDTSHGGRPRELGIAFPSAEWFILRSLNSLSLDFKRRDEYEVSYEATHHGPTSLAKPVFFVEIGSSINEWADPVNHAVVGEAVKSLISAYPPSIHCTPVIGIGGGHYPRKHTEVSLRENLCYGHIASKHALNYLDIELLYAMIKRTRERIDGVVVEKKSTRYEHRLLVEGFSKEVGINLKYI